mmetsp:Transcript_33615/g.74093  ORF Transcript_33615/g.74093 Transcript_33615/m.74093 type:complete len:688 (+) Transcript_33615:155-2218(+)
MDVLRGWVARRSNFRRKRVGLPFVCQTIALTLLVACGIYYTYMHSTDVLDGATDIYNRRLASTLCREGENDDEKDPVNCPDPAQPGGLAVLYFMGSIYLFLAIAIVCDEFFVPSLEVIADQWQISDDIAGATLMAAGGSAPELATSMIGTFTGSDIGFGTIVGSAVFNVLFVIAMCVLYTPEHLAPLQLTWWPLFRDCCCYVITLITLTIFFGVTSPGKIELWEAILQFLLYLVYCVIMAYNTQLQGYFSVQVAPSEGDEEEDKVPDKEASAKSETDESKRDRENYLLRPSRYRAGIYQLINGPDLDVGAAGVNVVSRIRGSVQEVFSQIDKDGVGKIRVEDIQRLLEMLNEGGSVAPESSKIVMDSLDTNKDGFIDLDEFTVWYTQSQDRMHREAKTAFLKYDDDQSTSIPLPNLARVLDDLNLQLSEGELERAMADLKESGARLSYADFAKWYEASVCWEKRKDVLGQGQEEEEEASEGIWADLMDFPKATYLANFMYLFTLPLTLPLACTVGVRDVRIAGNEQWCYWVFFASVAWIGGYAYILVDWITVVGATIQVPSVVMGLTLLAAGTSVPDLLSSVVVAKAGKGDMAVSSSIGSNIFDVTVGLPLPWMLFNLIYGCPVKVFATNLEVSIIVLLGMVVAVVLAVMWSDWRLSKPLGVVMMVLYVLFVAQDVIRVYLTTTVTC